MTKRLELVLFWHMHQPDYRDPASGEFLLPWVYLHALKDYSDMAAHLERHPGMRVVVNFVPVLTRQLEDYARQFAAGGVAGVGRRHAPAEFRDPLLRVLATEDPAKITAVDRARVLDLCFRANPRTMIEPFAGYARLAEIHRRCTADGLDLTDYLSGEYLTDLVTWYHLAWTGESLRQEHALLRRLLAQGSRFDFEARQSLVALIGHEIGRVIERWRLLAGRGQVELSTTPDCHPLGPLMVDFAAARDTQPGVALPQASGYPGGIERFAAHVDRAFVAHEASFGHAPVGVWPAEGAVSGPVVAALAARGSRWAASGEAVLMNSLRASGTVGSGRVDDDRVDDDRVDDDRVDGNRAERLYQPYILSEQAEAVAASGAGVRLFFRDDHLSDLIGFDYSRRHSGEAAAQFVAELEAIAAAWEGDTAPVVSVMLDGENAWEHFPYNGFYFLDELYRRLAAHPVIRPTTFAELISRNVPASPLARLSAGSWVYGNLATWIGAPEKNRAWDLLVEAKQVFDRVIDRLAPAAREEACRRLAVCEGSDWFWWFGDYNPQQTIASFDSLFRLHLTRLYQQLGQPVPDALAREISDPGAGGEAEGGGSMRRSAPAAG